LHGSCGRAAGACDDGAAGSGGTAGGGGCRRGATRGCTAAIDRSTRLQRKNCERSWGQKKRRFLGRFGFGLGALMSFMSVRIFIYIYTGGPEEAIKRPGWFIMLKALFADLL
jgi:hypothetical protein